MRILRPAGFALLALLLAAGASPGQPAPADSRAALDLAGYMAELSRWSTAAGLLRDHPERAAALRKESPDHWSVIVQGQRFEVPAGWLGSALDQVTAHPKLAADTSRQITTHLTSMLQDAQDLARSSDGASTQARARLNDILRRREFRAVHASDQDDSFWDQISDWLWDLLVKLFSRVGGHPRVTKVLLWTVVVALGLAFLAWLIYSLAHLSLATLLTRKRPLPVPAAEPVGSWQEWVRKAQAAASRRDYRDAVRMIYGAAVRRIEAAGIWQVDPARTHREYLRLLPAASAQHPPLAAITTCFERVWYGRSQACAADYETVMTELELLP